MSETDVDIVLSRLKKRQCIYNYCSPNWLVELNKDAKIIPLAQFARYNNLVLPSLNKFYLTQVNTCFNIREIQGQFGFLLDLNSGTMEVFLEQLATYALFIVLDENNRDSLNYTESVKSKTLSLNQYFSKSGLLYKNALVPLRVDLAKAALIALGGKPIDEPLMQRLGFFILKNILMNRSSQEFFNVICLNLPKSISNFPNFQLNGLAAINIKQIILMMKYIFLMGNNNEVVS